MKRRPPLVEYFLREHMRTPDLRIGTMLSCAEKLGDRRSVRAFNLPLEKTCCADPCSGCPTASLLCRAHCYYYKMIEGRSTVPERARLNWEIVHREDSYLLLAGAIRRANVPFFRPHDFGDFFSAGYIEAISRVAKICADVAMWCYTRAWRIERFVDPLASLAALPNMNLLLSADRQTGMPPPIPGTRVAWLADNDAEEPPEKVHVVFRASHERTPDGYVTELRQLGGSPTCVHENGAYSATETVVDKKGRERKKKLGPPDCVSCQHCLFKTCESRTADGHRCDAADLAISAAGER